MSKDIGSTGVRIDLAGATGARVYQHGEVIAEVHRRLNGCHNKPRPTAATTHQAQDGWLSFEGSRLPNLVPVPFRMSTTCQYDKSATDPGCAGCQHGAAATNEGNI